MPLIIAEAGVNHEGSMDTAKRLIDEACEGGAHAIKFQSYKAATREAFGKPCTFLRDHGCGIYSSRPLQCRLLLNMDEDALLCQLVEGGTINVPYLNTQEHHVDAVVILGAHQDYDDIRNWFPKTAQP